MSDKKGMVYLVGAGPSDPGLFTRKGYEVLQKADVVVYDALVGEGILAMIPDHARRINVGKRSHNHLMKQEDINQVLVSEGLEGNQVVRLKGGDPFLFGRGGEEMEALVEAGVACQVVPGVTSSLAVPAYAGIPVTHRDFCSSVHIITGHKRQGQEYDIDFEALVRTKGTLVFLMGIAALPELMKGLLAGGIDPDMHAAVLSKGTRAAQKRVVATVSTLEEEVKRQGIETPAIIVVGRVCELEKTLSWYEKQPLGGCKVILTRPKELISKMSAKLREQGAEVLELPAICTERIKDNQALETAFEELDTYSWLVFTSPMGVKLFFEEVKTRQIDVRRLSHLKIAAIGGGTAKELKERNLYPDLLPEIFDGEHLGKALAQVTGEKDRILIPRAAIGNAELISELERSGAKLSDIALYDTVYRSQDLIDVEGDLLRGEIDYVVFTSASTVKGFVSALEGTDFSSLTAVCIGEQTAREAAKWKMKVAVSKVASMDSLMEKVIELYRKEG